MRNGEARETERDEVGRPIHRMGGKRATPRFNVDRQFADQWKEPEKIRHPFHDALFCAALTGLVIARPPETAPDDIASEALQLANAAYKARMVQEAFGPDDQRE